MTDLPPPPGPSGYPPPGSGPAPPPSPPPWAQGPPPPYGPPPGYVPPPGYGYPAVPALPLANFGERLLAKLLDLLILSAAPFLISMLGVFVLVTGPDHESTCTTSGYYDEGFDGGEYYSFEEPCTVPDASTIVAAVLVFVVAAVVALLLYIYYFRREGRTGLTWGRKAMGIRLVGLHTNQPIGSWQAFGRGMFAYYISAAFCYLGYFWMLWDPQRQTWQDKVVDSKVIKG